MKKSIFLFLLLGIMSLTVCYGEINNSQNYGDVFFIQFADIHLCNNSEVKEIFGGKLPPVNITKEAVNEVIGFKPDLVIQTGDIVALAGKHDLDTDERWYKLVNTTIYAPIKKAGIPFLYAPGNHDPAGLKLKNVEKYDPRYGVGLLLKYLLRDKGTTYYSYDYGNYHFVIIDPVETEESGYRAVRLPKEELEWLKSDLANNSDKFIIIAYHQPLGSWENKSYNEFLDIISKYKGHILLIAGHTHDNRLIYRNGIPEYQGGAVCGDWWQTGKTPDGYPIGYVIYFIKNGNIYRFYKGIGYTEQINLLSPRNVVLNGTTPIELNVYDGNKTIVNITYKIDNGKLHPLNFTLINATKIWWYNAKGNIEITPKLLDDRKHNITIIVTAKDGSTFNRTFHYKFSNNPIMKISEITNDTNFKDYYGLFTTINGTILSVKYYGNLLKITDGSGNITIWAGDCKHGNFEVGEKVLLRGQITQYKGTKELKLIKGSDVKVYGFIPYPDVAPDIKSIKIKEIVHKAKLIVGSKIDANLSAKDLKTTFVLTNKPLDIEEDCILIGGPVANPIVKKYLWAFSVKVTNEYPGKHKGVIQKQIINGHTVILLAGSDRWGTKAAVEYFKTLEDIPEEPIFVEWKDGEAIKINKP